MSESYWSKGWFSLLPNRSYIAFFWVERMALFCITVSLLAYEREIWCNVFLAHMGCSSCCCRGNFTADLRRQSCSILSTSRRWSHKWPSHKQSPIPLPRPCVNIRVKRAQRRKDVCQFRDKIESKEAGRCVNGATTVPFLHTSAGIFRVGVLNS